MSAASAAKEGEGESGESWSDDSYSDDSWSSDGDDWSEDSWSEDSWGEDSWDEWGDEGDWGEWEEEDSGGTSGGGKGGGGSSGGGSSGSSGGAGGSVQICHQELYEEEVSNDVHFQAFDNVDDMVDKFMEGYGTTANYLRVYGGLVTSDNSNNKSDKNGNLGITFSRPVIFPEELIREYNSNYIEQIPELRPTDEELREIEA